MKFDQIVAPIITGANLFNRGLHCAD